ncbi:DUF2617 family protein [Williamsia sp. D3]|uniref:DUF2617 family protein n=1 Tax=Williamsia sp. D3 TaxID=1313067 RepID=UPI0003D2D310|nr:DUF2617 family protein [Williamsia sp. D3]ETD34209.1 hypothetical protein W823_03980 [Williamsia sp. D3]
MQAILAVPYSDTSADQLALSFDEPLLPALSTVRCQFDNADLTLRLLGASHQVSAVTALGETVETLACLPGQHRELPSTLQTPTVSFRARTERHNARSLSVLGAQISDRATGPHALIGHYPGSPDAFTAIIAADLGDRIRWDTWHAYPQTGDVVITSSLVQVR